MHITFSLYNVHKVKLTDAQTVYTNYFYDTWSFSVILSSHIGTFHRSALICISHDRRTNVIGIDCTNRTRETFLCPPPFSATCAGIMRAVKSDMDTPPVVLCGAGRRLRHTLLHIVIKLANSMFSLVRWWDVAPTSFDTWLHHCEGFYQNYLHFVCRLFIITEYKFIITVTQ